MTSTHMLEWLLKKKKTKGNLVLEMLWRFLEKLERELSYYSAILLLGDIFKKIESRLLKIYLHSRVPCIIHN